jgi:hypothetical protein
MKVKATLTTFRLNKTPFQEKPCVIFLMIRRW